MTDPRQPLMTQPLSTQSLIVQLLDAEFTAFEAALHACPDALFGRVPRVGHRVAWHALHVMDWTRATIQPGLTGPDPAHTFGYLGFEDTDWARAAHGPTLAEETDAPALIRAAVSDVFNAARRDLKNAPAGRFDPDATFQMFHKRRDVTGSVTYHLRHTAYHRGQIALVTKELQ
ncbi:MULTISPECIES: DinB family protein [Deinococcus]|uniref:DinB-like domain-containing protein n=1 Tax=Deinococcus soli (ex Cha et al. 2016) TaxID=1309411 RepID=A0A0F7JRK3_9DEIO|nr:MULTISPECIES: DinB family protein [Deinococcus]AKH17398.1 hypothetical protein SY84_10520 [Deinococcus soli (ex Cha et al. 2016)]MDK2012723.1 DinB family protein [Deinococcus sp. 43]GGB67954.1 hypothetical protein GCM10008019_25200 [Deinococcus soli (ex Cha et al. 2016)]